MTRCKHDKRWEIHVYFYNGEAEHERLGIYTGPISLDGTITFYCYECGYYWKGKASNGNCPLWLKERYNKTRDEEQKRIPGLSLTYSRFRA